MNKSVQASKTYSVFRVVHGDLSECGENDSIELRLVKTFDSIGKASQYMRSPEFIACLPSTKDSQFIITSSCHQYLLRPVTMVELEGRNNAGR